MARLTLPLALGALAVGVLVTFLLTRDEGSPRDGTPFALQNMLLQLGDLEPGYVRGDDTGCGAVTPEGRSPELEAVLGNTFPQYCINQFEHSDILAPPLIESAVVELPTPEVAAAVMAEPIALARFFFGMNRAVSEREFVDFADFADEAILLESEAVNSSDGGLIFGWRDGQRIHLIGVVAGFGRLELPRYIRLLAETQQGRSDAR